MTRFSIAETIPLQKNNFASIMEAVYYLTVDHHSPVDFSDFEIEYFTPEQEAELVNSHEHRQLTKAIQSLWL
jgi:hypothetical protein